MEINSRYDGNSCLIKISGEMNIYSASQIRDALLETFVRCSELEINLANVSEIDTVGIQLLILAKREFNSKQKVLRLSEHSHAVLDVVDIYNLAALFGDPVVMPSGMN